MSRLFTKNTSNNLQWTTAGTIQSKLARATAVTFSAWVKLSSLSATTAGSDGMFRLGIDGVNGGLIFKFDVNGNLGATVRSLTTDTAATVYGNRAIGLGQWAHVAVIIDYIAKTARFLIDGEHAGSAALAGMANTFFTPSGSYSTADYVGCTSATTTANQLDGLLAHPAIHRDRLSVTSIQDMQNGLHPMALPNCAMYFRFARGVTDSITGRNMTTAGTISQAEDPPIGLTYARRNTFSFPAWSVPSAAPGGRRVLVCRAG